MGGVMLMQINPAFVKPLSDDRCYALGLTQRSVLARAKRYFKPAIEWVGQPACRKIVLKVFNSGRKPADRNHVDRLAEPASLRRHVDRIAGNDEGIGMG